MRLHALQYLRAVAALVVVYSHAALQVEGYMTHLPQLGGFGVDVFFIISGFIMVWITKPADTPGQFIVNRVRRVVPLYWFFTLLMAATLVALPFVFKRAEFDLVEFLLSMAFVPYESSTHPGWLYPIVAPGWSLNYEMYFYALFALSLVLAPRWRVTGAITLLIAIYAVLKVVAPESIAARFYANDIVFEFVFGMLLAVAWQKGFRLSPFIAAILIGAGTVGLLMHLPLPRSITFGLPALLVVAGCLYVKLPEWRWAVVLGDASYALYLSHLFTLGALRVFLPALLGDGPAAAWSFVVISLVVCTLASLPVHFLIDNWLLRRERYEGTSPSKDAKTPSGPGPAETAPGNKTSGAIDSIATIGSGSIMSTAGASPHDTAAGARANQGRQTPGRAASSGHPSISSGMASGGESGA